MDKKTVAVLVIIAAVLVIAAAAYFLISRGRKSKEKDGENKISCWDGASSGNGCRNYDSALSRALENKKQRYEYIPPADINLVFTRNNKHKNLYSLSDAHAAQGLYEPNMKGDIHLDKEVNIFKFKINRLNSSNSEAEFVYGIDGEIYLFNVAENNITKFRALLDTGSKALIIQSDQSAKMHEKEDDVHKEILGNGVWETGYTCLIPDSDRLISYGGGAVNTQDYNTYVVNHDNLAAGLNISVVLSGDLVYNICGLIPGFEYDKTDSGFINYIFDGMSNCERGFILDLVNDVFTLGEIRVTQNKIPLLGQEDLRFLYVNPPPIPYYMTYLKSINGVEPDKKIFVLFDSGNTFMTVSNDYTRGLIQNAIGAKDFDDTETHNKVTFGFEGDIEMTSRIPLSMDESYVVLQSPFKKEAPNGYNIDFNIIIVGLTFQLDRVISYDIDNLIMYID